MAVIQRTIYDSTNRAPRSVRALARAAMLQAQREREKLGRVRESNAEEVARLTRSPFAWVTEATETYNEHWLVEGRPTPYEKFPPYPYLEALFDILDAERIHWFEKSRDMMITWLCVAYLTYQAMTTSECGILVQTQKEGKAVQLVDYAKCLYRRQGPVLREFYPLEKSIERQDVLTLAFANGSYIHGIPGGADQIRSYHPWGYLNDETSFQPEAGECFTEALSAAKGKIVFNSSAGPGWYCDVRKGIVKVAE